MKKISMTNLSKWVGITLIFIAIILTMIFFMQGSTTVSGEFPNAEEVESLSCTAENIDYPTFTYDNSKRKIIHVNVTFNNDELQSISLVHTLYYNNSKEVTDSEAINHAAVNIDSKAADIFDAHYSKFSDAMTMTMYAERKNINNANKKYVMLNLIYVDNLDKASVKWNYETLGFDCGAD